MPTITYKDLPEFRPIDKEGKYTAEITAAKEEISPKGDDTLVITYTTEEGAKIIDTLYFTERAQWRIEALLKACQIPGLEKETEYPIDDKTFIGYCLQIEVKGEGYLDKKTNEKKVGYKIARFLPLPAKTAPLQPVASVPAAAKQLPRAPQKEADDLPY